MKISIYISYHTDWGESLHIWGALPCLGNGEIEKSVEMELAGPDIWSYETILPDAATHIDFRFAVKENGKVKRREWGAPHRVSLNATTRRYRIEAAWRDMPHDRPFMSTAFTQVMLRRNGRSGRITPKGDTLLLQAIAPDVREDEVLAVSGEGETFGDWNPARAPVCSDAGFPIWEVQVPLGREHLPLRYKYIILKEGADASAPQVRAWEEGDNRIFDSGAAPDETMVVECPAPRLPASGWKGAGTAVPVFSLRSEEDYGCGDFMDLLQLIDWASATGQKIIQLLPVNDTTKTRTRGDSYPYSACSCFALHPMYIRPDSAGALSDNSMRRKYRDEADRLNALEEIDYEGVIRLKEEYMHRLYAERGATTRRLDSYRDFEKENSGWLRPYAAWCVMRDINGTPDSRKWGDCARCSRETIEKILTEHPDEAGYHIFVQYHLHLQLKKARDYARQHGVALKGDIPIGVDRDSADTWQYPELFNPDSQAGAPPDDFAKEGQNWGFPTYNWEAMKRDGYRWWKRRLGKMADYFDAYRVDHILGFFRIWEIPAGIKSGILGHFNPALPYSAEELRSGYGFEIKGEMILSYKGEKKPDENILFIEDPKQKGLYHPRISAWETDRYKELGEEDRKRFDRLYHDFYYARNEDFWRQNAMRKLPELTESTEMLCCAEDLGMIPQSVPEVLDALRLLSLRVERMPTENGKEFDNPGLYPYWSVCATSTHDMPGIRVWWETMDAAKRERYYHDELGLQGEAPEKAEPWICSEILKRNLGSSSILCILPLQDWLSQDGVLRRDNAAEEQINDPTNPDNYWGYRMHVTLERLIGDEAFSTAISDAIQTSGR